MHAKPLPGVVRACAVVKTLPLCLAFWFDLALQTSPRPDALILRVEGATFAIPLGIAWDLTILRDYPASPDPAAVLVAAEHLQWVTLGDVKNTSRRSPHKMSSMMPAVGLSMAREGDAWAQLISAADATVAYLSDPAACASLRTTGQYTSATLVLARVLEYASRAALGRQLRGCNCSSPGVLECDDLPAAGSPCAGSVAPPPDWVLFPVDLTWLEGSASKFDAFHAHVQRTIDGFAVDSSRAVFFLSRSGRDMFLEEPYARFRALFLDAPRSAPAALSRAVFVTAEGHPPWYWGSVPFVDQSVEIPFSTSLHARAGGICQGRESAWARYSDRARPIRVAMASGARLASRVRTRVRGDMLACATSAALAPGTCAIIDLTNSSGSSEDVELSVTALYAASIFCIMPPGDTPLRRGFWDAILLGCIPVTLRPTVTRLGHDQRAPRVEHYPPWKYALADVLPLYEVLDAGGAFIDDDVLEGRGSLLWWQEPATVAPWLGRLLAIPPARVARMQAELLRLAAGFQSREPGGPPSYAEAVRGSARDATDWLLLSLARKGRQRRRERLPDESCAAALAG